MGSRLGQGLGLSPGPGEHREALGPWAARPDSHCQLMLKGGVWASGEGTRVPEPVQDPTEGGQGQRPGWGQGRAVAAERPQKASLGRGLVRGGRGGASWRGRWMGWSQGAGAGQESVDVRGGGGKRAFLAPGAELMARRLPLC